MVEGIRKCIIELKNLEQGIEYAVADINKRNAALASQEQNIIQLTSEVETLKKENEELKNKKEKTIKKIGQFSKKAETLPYDYDYLNGVSDVIKIVEENL